MFPPYCRPQFTYPKPSPTNQVTRYLHTVAWPVIPLWCSGRRESMIWLLLVCNFKNVSNKERRCHASTRAAHTHTHEHSFSVRLRCVLSCRIAPPLRTRRSCGISVQLVRNISISLWEYAVFCWWVVVCTCACQQPSKHVCRVFSSNHDFPDFHMCVCVRAHWA